MRHAGIGKLAVRVEATAKEAAEKGGGSGAVETVVVIEDSCPHLNVVGKPFIFSQFSEFRNLGVHAAALLRSWLACRMAGSRSIEAIMMSSWRSFSAGWVRFAKIDFAGSATGGIVASTAGRMLRCCA